MQKFISTEFWNEILTGISNWVISELPSILILIVLMIISIKIVSSFVNKLNKLLIKRAKKLRLQSVDEAEKRINTLMGITKGVLRIIVWSIFIMILLKKFGIDIGPILAGAGILGLAVGFGAQELVRDFISGFFMLLENQVRAGDVAIINGTGGLVEKIELRTITLRDFSGVVHIYQNGKINSLSNMTKEWSAIVFEIGVAYKEKLDKVMKIMADVGEDMTKDPDFKQHIINPLEIFGLDKFADSALIIKARLKTKPGQQWAVGREYRKRLKKAFDEQNIEIPFPHTTLYWGDEIKPLNITMEKINKPNEKSN
mgnify:CR=1 FL=1